MSETEINYSNESSEFKKDLIDFEPILVRADTGKRFANYLIDVIIFYLLAMGVGVIIALISPETLNDLDDNSTSFSLWDRILSIVLYGLYMSLVEGIFKGKSLGKLITGTKALNLDGSEISFSKAFERGFSRAVPFCVFSALSTPCNPWQDKWTNTIVVDVKQSHLV